jgi:hypothetical protein
MREKLYQYGLNTQNEVGTIPPFRKKEKYNPER